MLVEPTRSARGLLQAWKSATEAEQALANTHQLEERRSALQASANLHILQRQIDRLQQLALAAGS